MYLEDFNYSLPKNLIAKRDDIDITINEDNLTYFFNSTKF